MMASTSAAIVVVTAVCFGVYGWFVMGDDRLASRLMADVDDPKSRAKLFGRVAVAMMGLASSAAEPILNSMPDRRIAMLRHRLDAAGRPANTTVELFVSTRIVWSATSAAIGLFVLTMSGPFLAFMIVAGGSLWPDLWLELAKSKRQREIDAALPDMLDIVAISVGAGMSVRGAIGRVGARLEGALGEELATMLAQMEYGLDSRSAFEALRDRNDSVSLGHLAAGLIQSDELGAPPADALQNLARDMRREFHQSARRRAAKASPKIAMVVGMFMAPGALALIIGALIVGGEVSPLEMFAG